MRQHEKLLFIDLTQRKAFVGFTLNEKILFHAYSDEMKNHSAFFYSSLEKINKDISPLKLLDGIVVCIGYGSYTGIRVALSTVLGLVQSQIIPIIPIHSFEVLAYASMLSHSVAQKCSLALFTRKNEFLFTHYSIEENIFSEFKHFPNDVSVEDQESISSPSFYFYDYEKDALLDGFPFQDFHTTPYRGEAVIKAGMTKFKSTSFVLPSELKPLYMKDVFLTTPKRKF